MPDTEHQETKRKVDFSVFVWVVSILSGAMLMISGFLFSELATMRATVAAMQARVDAEREQRMTVLISLEQIKGDIRLMRDQLERRPAR